MQNKPFYFIAHKPFNMLSQFTDSENRPVLSALAEFPKDVYPVGRLDRDSEGLLMLTNDKGITEKLLNPRYRHEREYYALVEGTPGNDALKMLSEGIVIEGKKTLPAKVHFIEQPDWLAERIPPPALRKSHAYSWLSLTIREGRNRQVRKMTAAAGHPTLRLIRWRIANITLGGLPQNKVRELTASEISELKSYLAKKRI